MEVISFRKSFSELDALAEARDVVKETLAQSIESAAEYAPEVSRSGADKMREHLRQLAAQVPSISTSEEFKVLHASFRGELRDYRDKVQMQVDQMRVEVANAVEAMSIFIEGVTAAGDNQETILKREFNTLAATAQAGTIEQIRSAISQTAKAALKSCEDVKRSNQLIIAQLQDEIRSLHQEVEKEHRAALTDQATNLWNREKLDTRTKDLMLLDEPFCMFMIGIANLPALSRQHPAHIVQECVKAAGGRLKAMAGQEGMVGRWNQDVLSIIFNLPLAGVSLSAQKIQDKLAGPYSVQDEGVANQIHLEIHVETVERPKGVGEALFYPKLGQAAFGVVSRLSAV
jgi:GGDEF domain-containing protein